MNILSIDTTDRNEVKISIQTQTEKFEKIGIRNTEMDVTLLTIEKVLTESGLKISDIDEIQVKEGPGSFTGVRVGVSIANALSFTSTKSVNGKKLGNIAEPVYD